jgi:hypothetical protein
LEIHVSIRHIPIVRRELAGAKLRLCSPAALVVFKVFAGHPQDRLDVEGIVIKSGNLVDWSEVRRDLGELLDLKGDTESLSRLETIMGSAAHR